MKKYIFLIVIFMSAFAKAQEVRVDNIIYEDIYADSNRDERVKNIATVQKVNVTRTEMTSGDINKKEFWYEKGLYVKGIDSSKTDVMTYLNSYYDSGKIKTIKTIYKDYPVTKDSYHSYEHSDYFHFKDKVEEHMYEEDSLTRIREYNLKDGVIKSYLLYGPEKVFGSQSNTYLIRTYFHVWNYTERIKTSKDSFHEEEGITYTYDEKDRIISLSDATFTHTFKYENNLLITATYVDDRGDTSGESYEYDASGNWIKKTEVENGEIVVVTTRTITYIK